MIADDPLALLLHAPMSDEACAHIWEFLSDLAFFFESARFAHIRRSHYAQGDHRAKTPDSPFTIQTNSNSSPIIHRPDQKITQNPKLTLRNFILLFYGKFRLLVTL
ncbi:hypothetical protein [Ferrovum myxofaciens]|nr:hypothetical protein [Ferrovum myxofaciens]MBU6994772.1 hypothetical protein [Ferrovum myxofaciens]